MGKVESLFRSFKYDSIYVSINVLIIALINVLINVLIKYTKTKYNFIPKSVQQMISYESIMMASKQVSYISIRGVSGGWAGWAIAHPVFGRIEGVAGQRRRAALLLAHPVLRSQLRP